MTTWRGVAYPVGVGVGLLSGEVSVGLLATWCAAVVVAVGVLTRGRSCGA